MGAFRRSRWPAFAAATAAASIATMLTAGPSSGAAARPIEPGPSRPAGTAVTLITGDRVVLSGPDGKDVGIVPGKDRHHVTFRSYRKAGKLTVMPSDAERFVASGRLDPRLFDITGLVEGGFDDRRSPSLPLIVAYDGAAGRASVRKSGGTTVRELPAVNGSAIRVAKGTRYLTALPVSGARFGGGIERVWLDGRRRVVLDQSVPQIGAPAAWQAGYTGTGVTVAVLDTGVDASHPDLADRVTEAKNFTDQPAGDEVGHGTHVASTIAGTAAASDGRYKGVAPDARILDGKVCGDLYCPDSAILAGMQWAAVEKNADVVNVSIGAGNGPEIDPLEEAVNTLTAQTGTLFVIAAGNSGPDAGTVESPGSAEAALTVGAVDKSDQLAPFSSRGPRAGDAGVKPDVTAPGVDIVAARSEVSIIGAPVGDRYLRASGTSMATPHVAGAAALLAQQHPDWTATELKAVLMSSAKPHAEQSAFEQGTGRVDVAKAITQSVLAVPGSLSFGTSSWPHGDDEPVRKQLTFRNTGATAIDLALDASLTGPDGQPAPVVALTLSADKVSVPAGGTAAVAVTSDTRHGGPEGVYTGQVRVIGAATGAITVPLSAELEPERYDVTVRHLGPDGKPTGQASTWITGIDNDAFAIAQSPGGVAKVRLPKGRYFIEGGISTDRGNERYGHYTILQPILQVDKDTAITIDARTAKPVTTTIPRADAGLHYYDQTAVLTAGPEPVGFHLISFAEIDLFTASLGEPVPAKQFTAGLNSAWGVTGPGGSLQDSPYSYHLMNTTKGAYWNGFSRRVRDSELAKIAAEHHWQDGGRRAMKMLYGYTDDGTTMVAGSQSYTLPARAVHYLEAGANWRTSLEEWEPDDLFWTTILASPYRSYHAGRSYAERWNAAVFGPTVVPVFPGDRYAARTVDRIRIGIPAYSDPDHAGDSATDAGSAKLYRNGELVAEPEFGTFIDADDLAGESAEFELVTSESRPSVSNLSTRTDLRWTFRSQTASAEGESLPLWAARYAPSVDERNAVKRRPVTVVPLRLEAAADSPVGSVTKVEVQVSGDDGGTWRNATVRRTGGNRYVAVFATPAGDHVSLKAKSADSRGNTTEQTIVRAFQLR